MQPICLSLSEGDMQLGANLSLIEGDMRFSRSEASRLPRTLVGGDSVRSGPSINKTLRMPCESCSPDRLQLPEIDCIRMEPHGYLVATVIKFDFNMLRGTMARRTSKPAY